MDDNELMKHLRKTIEFNMSLQNGSYKDFLNNAKRRETQSKFVLISKEMMELNCQK